MSETENRFPLLNLLSGWGAVSGPGLFMFRSLVSGVSTAAVVGASSAMAGSVIWGTAAVPFLIGSCIGFTVGSFRWYDVVTKEALRQLELYPSLLRLHIAANFPWVQNLHRKGEEWYTAERFQSSWKFRSMLVVGWLSAEPALRDVKARQEARLVEQYTGDSIQ